MLAGAPTNVDDAAPDARPSRSRSGDAPAWPGAGGPRAGPGAIASAVGSRDLAESAGAGRGTGENWTSPARRAVSPVRLAGGVPRQFIDTLSGGGYGAQ